MIEQVSNSLMVVAFFADSLGQGVTGLTVTVDAWRVINNAGTPTPTQVLTDAAATSLGGGFYARIIAAADVTVEASYIARFKTTSSSVRDRQLPAMWSVGVAGVERLDANISAVDEIVWDVTLASHLTAGSTGAALDDAAAAASSGGSLDVDVINIDGVNLVGYGSHHTEALGASVLDLAIPNRATVIALQATGQNIYFTNDGSTTPTSSVGFVLFEGNAPIFLSLDDSRAEGVWKFLRSAAGANLQYRFYRPE